MIIVGAISAVAILMLVIMLFVLYFKRGKKKLPPADVIPEVCFLFFLISASPIVYEKFLTT